MLLKRRHLKIVLILVMSDLTRVEEAGFGHIELGFGPLFDDFGRDLDFEALYFNQDELSM